MYKRIENGTKFVHFSRGIFVVMQRFFINLKHFILQKNVKIKTCIKNIYYNCNI